MSGQHSRLAAVSVAHGNPRNALADNEFTRTLARLAAGLPRPRAVLVVSARWLTRGTRVLSVAAPRTIRDVGGFPSARQAVQCPAPGAPELASRVRELVPEADAHAGRGLDHAGWAIARHLRPPADVPVVELSLETGAAPAAHWDIGRRLAPLRDEGVRIVGRGNIVHSFARVSREPDIRPWLGAVEFDARVADALTCHDSGALVDNPAAGPSAARSVATHDSCLPLLCAAAGTLWTTSLRSPARASGWPRCRCAARASAMLS
jgi:4,5-DOPA dioxygenase extradiol